jgi:hypothetical protein
LRHPWEAVLSVTVVAVLAGMKSLEAIARFGRDHGPPLAHALGFRRGKTPAKATLRKLFRRLDIDALEAVLRWWLSTRCLLIAMSREKDSGRGLGLLIKTIIRLLCLQGPWPTPWLLGRGQRAGG